ncbi:hypothetical protein PUV54_00120 [Hyphococcus flavus]|uniref:Uncharacterized protein n=1 Tax=Hyphococcus flavus TaxID=1866326 RepID=A0AAE9ZBI6_9PROT|nr:hypothetical protein [Hyphococcus flavus]WDI31598.1 hypothetical protein PUV54_00120 [Hyphococcus flavus]
MTQVKIRLKTHRAGVRFSQAAGEIITVDKETAKRMIDSDQAEKVTKAQTRRNTAGPETATAGARETRDLIG